MPPDRTSGLKSGSKSSAGLWVREILIVSFCPWIISIIFWRLSDTYFISTSLLSGPSWRSDFAFREIFFNIFLQGHLQGKLKISSLPNPQIFKFSIFGNFFEFSWLFLIFISLILLFLTILNQRKNDGFTTTKPTHKTWDQSQSFKIFIHS